MKKTLIWILAVIITAGLSYYQRATGPTNPKKLTVEINGGRYDLKFPRSGVQVDEIISLEGLPKETEATLHYHRYPTNDAYTDVPFEWNGDKLEGILPVQPVAGKLAYYMTIDGKEYFKDEPLLIRFRNDVPAGVMIPHILLMFLAMLFAVYTMLIALFKFKQTNKWLVITVVTLFVGGFIFGPLMQHYAFGPYWTGFPFGTDLTDNKTLISFIFFLVALFTRKWKYNRYLIIAASVIMMLIFTIPHSANGSEYNYETEQLN